MFLGCPSACPCVRDRRRHSRRACRWLLVAECRYYGLFALTGLYSISLIVLVSPEAGDDDNEINRPRSVLHIITDRSVACLCLLVSASVLFVFFLWSWWINIIQFPQRGCRAPLGPLVRHRSRTVSNNYSVYRPCQLRYSFWSCWRQNIGHRSSSTESSDCRERLWCRIICRQQTDHISAAAVETKPAKSSTISWSFVVYLVANVGDIQNAKGIGMPVSEVTSQRRCAEKKSGN